MGISIDGIEAQENRLRVQRLRFQDCQSANSGG